MTTKINLSNMEDSDYKALLENSKVMDKLIEYTTESAPLSASLLINDWLDLLDGLRDYSLGGSYDHNYMCIQDSYKFLKSVLIAQKEYCVLTDENAEIVENSLTAYDNAEPSDLSYYDEKLDRVGELIADKLIELAKNEYDFAMSEHHLLDTMKYDNVLVDLYGDDAYYNREDNKIYYICAD